MAEFPAKPLSPQEFLEQFLPKSFADRDLPEDARETDLKLGVRLDGDGGGEWLIHLNRGSLSVAAGSREEAAFTVIQTVVDWRGALWEGRGGAFGKQATALFVPGEESPSTPGAMGGAPSAAALGQLAALDGVIKMVVADCDSGDWSVAFKFGPGQIPEEPTTTVTISAEDATAMEKGELDPMQAFMAGRIQVAGDMTLMMQMQAIQMQAAQQGAS